MTVRNMPQGNTGVVVCVSKKLYSFNFLRLNSAFFWLNDTLRQSEATNRNLPAELFISNVENKHKNMEKITNLLTLRANCSISNYS